MSSANIIVLSECVIAAAEGRNSNFCWILKNVFFSKKNEEQKYDILEAIPLLTIEYKDPICLLAHNVMGIMMFVDLIKENLF